MRARAHRVFAGTAALLIALAGCSILDVDSMDPVKHTAFLKPIPKPRNAIDLEIYRTRRPIGDPDLGESLWKGLQEVSSADVTARKRLRAEGFRAGHVGSMPPASLTRLLQNAGQEETVAVKPLRISVSAGQPFDIPTCPVAEQQLVDLDGEGGAEARLLSYVNHNLRCTASKVQDGWGRLVIVPEIRYGVEVLRPVPNPETGGYMNRTQQEIVPFYDQRFEIELNEGEYVVLTADAAAKPGLATEFFHGTGDLAGQQEVVIIKLRGLSEVEPVRVE